MFKFNFQVEEEQTGNDDVKEEQKQQEHENEPIKVATSVIWYTAQEVKPTADVLSTLDFCDLNATEVTFGTTCIRHVLAGNLLADIKTHANDSADIKQSEQKHSDLLPGIYEGGAKIWECTDDLLQYLADNYAETWWQGKRVLDLGCGSGLLGIYALKNGATVHFQDYNQDVLEKITIPNVLLNQSNTDDNLDSAKFSEDAKFYAGDWSHFVALPELGAGYDVILTCETIYNPENQSKLLNVFIQSLKSAGVVIVAAKTYYFGVGGGLRQFEQLIADEKRLQSKVLWSSHHGVNREIIEVRFL